MKWIHSHNSNMILADITLLCTAAIWGGGFIAAKEALVTMSAFSILASRFLLSALLLFFLFYRRIRRAAAKELRFGMLLGLIQYIAFICQLEGLKTTTVEKQSFLVTSYVIFVPALSWLITKKHIHPREIGCALLALCGLALLCLHSDTLVLASGDILSIGFAVFFALQIVYVGNVVKNADIFSMTFFQFLTTGLLALPFLDISGLQQVSVSAIYGMLYLVILNTTFAFLAQNMAQQYTKDTHASLIISLESVFGFFMAVWFYHDPVTLQEGAGCLIMMAAIILSKVKV